MNKIKENKEFHSSHYHSSSIEPIDFIMSNNMTFNRGNIVKYAFRAGKKEGQEVLDIKKIIDYALLLAIENNISIEEDDILSLIKYRFDWKSKRKDGIGSEEKRIINRIYELIDQGLFENTEMQALLSDIEARLGPNHEEVLKIVTSINYEKIDRNISNETN